ncbi:hypothetical protein ACFIJ5_17295 [Haloimpatiens sp. FM7330]|uniref:hypothetical protein n=1 Tax=Haloimpatiens sp. FM7330 TaxID=3298610 RepID=UPI003625F740
MKRNIYLLFLISIFMLILQGCSKPKLTTIEKISAPQNNLIPISGTWKITDYKSINNSTKKPAKTLVGKSAEFDKNMAVLGDEVCKNPEYKIKIVNSNDYFLYVHKIDAKDLGIKNSKIQVISITSKDKLFYEFIKISDTELIVFQDNTFFTLNKSSNDTNEIVNKSPEDSKQNFQSKTDISSSNSGVFLGIRSSSTNISKKNSTYRTIWLSVKNKKIDSLKKSPNLFVPRKSGFWEVGLTREHKNSFTQDVLFANPIEIEAENKSGKELLKDINNDNNKPIPFEENIYRNILFIGNDYVATEYSSGKNIKSNILNKLQVLPVDNIQNNIGIKISDIAGENAKTVLINSANSYLSSQKEDKIEQLETIPKEESFTLIRKNGHWIMRGRLNSIDPENIYNFADFNINLFPPKKMLNYDELYVSWNQVKSKVPNALDIYTSPNKDISLVVCKNTIYVYALNNGLLSSNPIKTISLKENESIIMAEWATGNYVEKWEEAFKNSLKQK